MQQEIILKERRIGDLEAKLRSRDESIQRLKTERDRLVTISNDLRAELNTTQRRLIEYSEEALLNDG